MLPETKIILAALWICIMLIYLLGDVLRIMSGDMATMMAEGDIKFTQGVWLGIAAMMLIPIIMIMMSLVLPYNINRWAQIIVAVIVFLFNLVALPTYPSAYDKFLLAVSLVFNVVTVVYAWNWVETA